MASSKPSRNSSRKPSKGGRREKIFAPDGTETGCNSVAGRCVTQQFEIDFEGGLTQRFPAFMDCVRDSVYGCGRQFKAIASDLDMSPSELSKRLSPSGDIHFALERLPELVDATRNLNPIFWLVERYCGDPEKKRKQAIAQLPTLVAQLQQLVKDAEA